MQYLSRLVHFCCPASRNARKVKWAEVEAPPNLFTTAVEKAAKKAVYAKRFRSCHIGTNTCRSACLLVCCTYHANLGHTAECWKKKTK